MQGPHIFPLEMLKTLMVCLWRVTEVLRRCLSEGHIACGVSQDTCPMIMFMKIMTGLGSCRVLSLENSWGLNFKLYCYPWKRAGRFGRHVRETSVQLARCLWILTKPTVKADALLFFSLLFSAGQCNWTDKHRFSKHKSADFDTIERQDVPTCSDHIRVTSSIWGSQKPNCNRTMHRLRLYVLFTSCTTSLFFGHLILIDIFHQIGQHLWHFFFLS